MVAWYWILIALVGLLVVQRLAWIALVWFADRNVEDLPTHTLPTPVPNEEEVVYFTESYYSSTGFSPAGVSFLLADEEQSKRGKRGKR